MLPNNPFCPSCFSRLALGARDRAASIELNRPPRQASVGRLSLSESKAPALTRLSTTRLLRVVDSTRSAKSTHERHGPLSRASQIALTMECPSPLIAVSPYRMAPLKGVKPE